MKCDFRGHRFTKQHLVVEFTLRHMAVKKVFTVRVPLRRLNEDYEEMGNALASEASRELRRINRPVPLPLEVWE